MVSGFPAAIRVMIPAVDGGDYFLSGDCTVKNISRLTEDNLRKLRDAKAGKVAEIRSADISHEGMARKLEQVAAMLDEEVAAIDAALESR